jgi:WD40 repeat protein
VLGGLAIGRVPVVLAMLLLSALAAGVGVFAWPTASLPPEADPPKIATDKAAAVLTPAADRFGDPLPAGVALRLGTLRFRHKAAVMHVAFSPDGKTLASASLDGTVRLWESATGKEVRRLAAAVHFPQFPWFGGRLTFAPDGKMLALARYSLDVWDLTPDRSGQSKHLSWNPKSSYLTFQFTDGGKLLAALGTDKELRVLDVVSGKEQHRFEDAGWLENAALSPDGRTLAALQVNRHSRGAGDTTLRLWDLTTGKELRPAEPWRRLGRSLVLVFAPDGKSLAVSDGEQARVLHIATRKEIWHAAVKTIGPLAFTPDGKGLAVGENRTVRLLDLASGQEKRTFDCFQFLEALAFAPDGKTLAAGSGSYMHRLHPQDDECGGTVHVWDVASGRRLGPADTHLDVVTCVVYSPDGNTVASGSRDRTVRLWDAVTGAPGPVLAGHQDDVLSLAFAPDGRRLASGSRDKTLRLWDLAAGRAVRTFKLAHGVYALAYSADSKTLAAADGKSVQLIDTVTEKMALGWAAEKVWVYALAFAPDCKMLAWAGGQRVFLPDSGDNTIRLTDPVTGKERARLPGRLGDMAVCSLGYSPRGDVLAAGYMNTVLSLWQQATGKLLHRISTRAEGTVTFSPDGKTLAVTGPLGATISLYETATGQLRRQIDSPQGGVYAVAFSPNGAALASAGQDGTVLVWRLTGQARKSGP